MHTVKNVIIGSIVAALAGTGFARTSTPTTAPRVQDAVLEDAQARAVNGGINPDYFAYEISGRVLLGGNPCSARGNRARLVQQSEGATVVVKAERILHRDEHRVCTREWNPVYADVKTTVRARHSLVSEILVKNAGEMGVDRSVEQLLGYDTIVIESAEATPLNGGINPDAFAVRIDAKVMKGANPCMAANTEVALQQELSQGVVRVKAVRRIVDPTRICTMEYRPVYTQVSTDVRAFHSQVSDVIVQNVGERGHDVSVDAL